MRVGTAYIGVITPAKLSDDPHHRAVLMRPIELDRDRNPRADECCDGALPGLRGIDREPAEVSLTDHIHHRLLKAQHLLIRALRELLAADPYFGHLDSSRCEACGHTPAINVEALGHLGDDSGPDAPMGGDQS